MLKKNEDVKLDVLCYVCNLDEVQQITTRQHKVTKRLNFEIMDQTARVKVTLGCEQANSDIEEHDLIALKTAKVSNYNGKSLTLICTC